MPAGGRSGGWFILDLEITLARAGNSGRDLVVDDLDHLEHFLEAGCCFDGRANAFLTWALDSRWWLDMVLVTGMNWIWLLVGNLTALINGFGRAALIKIQRRRAVTLLAMGVPSLVMIMVLCCFTGAAGLGFAGPAFGAFLGPGLPGGCWCWGAGAGFLEKGLPVAGCGTGFFVCLFVAHIGLIRY